ncbi:MAG: HD superfamily phosphohydrolase [Polaribacter sp.]|jgi:HD superfamily phosphohydrolase
MKGKNKIFNDPVYGFITIPRGLLLDIIDHPFFQRLRRISQLGLTYYVYPGATHSRFHHTLGAYHLMSQAIDVLRSKDVSITEEEAQGVKIAILLHDIGHGPFSHALEHTIVNVHHEFLSLEFMRRFNEIFDGQLQTAIDIFTNKHPKKFLYQLVSGQLDMDRLDYLNRDSFYTGVYEGVIGYDRIIKMLDVQDDELVVEVKGIYSIEKFLIARRLMYWQVYLHKTAFGAEQMLIHALKRAKQLAQEGELTSGSKNLDYFLNNSFDENDFKSDDSQTLVHFSNLDDTDIISALKSFAEHEDEILSFLAHSIINRKLFRTEINNIKFKGDYVESIRLKIRNQLGTSSKNLDFLLYEKQESNNAYNKDIAEIKILFGNGEVKPISVLKDHEIPTKVVTKHFLCYPKNIY